MVSRWLLGKHFSSVLVWVVYENRRRQPLVEWDLWKLICSLSFLCHLVSIESTYKEESYCWQSLTCYFCLVENTELCGVDLSLFGVGAKGVSVGYVWVCVFC